jgi:hypothetical protein
VIKIFENIIIVILAPTAFVCGALRAIRDLMKRAK